MANGIHRSSRKGEGSGSGAVSMKRSQSNIGRVVYSMNRASRKEW